MKGFTVPSPKSACEPYAMARKRFLRRDATFYVLFVKVSRQTSANLNYF